MSESINNKSDHPCDMSANGLKSSPQLRFKRCVKHRSTSVSEHNGYKQTTESYKKEESSFNLVPDKPLNSNLFNLASVPCEEGGKNGTSPIMEPNLTNEGTGTVNSRVRIRSRRSYSISMTDPVSRTTFESMPFSPATEFLARFAHSPNVDSTELRISRAGSLERLIEETIEVDTIETPKKKIKLILGRCLGKGQFGECREATLATIDLRSKVFTSHSQFKEQTKFAAKLYRLQGDSKVDDGVEKIYRHELSIWRRFDHPNILPILAFSDYNPTCFVIVTPLAAKGDLLQYMNKNGPFSGHCSNTRRIFSQIAAALQYMHDTHDVAHRDVKLENIFLDDDLNAYVGDFGLAESYNEQGKLESPHIINGTIVPAHTSREYRCEVDYCKGSLWYLAPEDIESTDNLYDQLGYREARKRGDVWALGVLLYAMVTGSLPFSDDLVPRLQRTIVEGIYPPLDQAKYPSELISIISRLLVRDVFTREPLSEILATNTWLRTPPPS